MAVMTMTSHITTPRYRFTVEDYHRMVEAGILAEDARVELINGQVREMTPIRPRHLAVVNRLSRLLTRQLFEQAIVSVQNPVRLSDDTEPQPNLAVLRWRDDDYAARLPGPSDVLLIIEVAESSSGYDRNEKLPRYAQAGIAEVWLVDLVNEVVEHYTGPRGDQYGTKQTLESGQTIRGQHVAVELAVHEILP